jgi:hypothetical protein
MKRYIFYAQNLIDNKTIGKIVSHNPPCPNDFWECGYREIESYFDEKENIYIDSFQLNEKQKIDNIYYNYDLCSQGGLYTILILPENTKEEIKQAEQYLKHNFDVVQLSRLKIDQLI